MPKDISKYSHAKLVETIENNSANSSHEHDAVGTTVTVKRLILAASACTAAARTQDITIYTKTAAEGIANVRVRWGSSKFNYGARDIAGVSAGDFANAEYFTQGGVAWGPNGYRHRYFMNTLAHYPTAGVITVSITLAVGQDVGDISTGTIEVFLDVIEPGDGTTIS